MIYKNIMKEDRIKGWLACYTNTDNDGKTAENEEIRKKRRDWFL